MVTESKLDDQYDEDTEFFDPAEKSRMIYYNSIAHHAYCYNSLLEYTSCENKLIHQKCEEFDNQLTLYETMKNSYDSWDKITAQTKYGIETLMKSNFFKGAAEVIILGVSGKATLDPEVILERILAILGVSNLVNQVIDLRVSNDEKCDKKNITVTLVSPVVRDLLVATSSDLPDGCIQISGIEGSLTIRPVWPKFVDELLRDASSISKHLGYAEPVVRNSIVCLRKTDSSTEDKLIPVFSKKDLKCYFDDKLSHKSNLTIKYETTDTNNNQNKNVD